MLGAAVAALGYLATRYGDAAFAGWSLLVVAVLYAIAHRFAGRARRLEAGIFAYAAVVTWGVFVGSLWVWFGWLSVGDAARLPFRGFSVARLSLELLVLAAASHARRRFRFPFVTSLTVLVGWLFLTDLVSGGGSWSAVVTLLVGLAYLAVGGASDRPSAFWFQLASGLLIGGSLLYWWHSSDWNWALIAVVALLYVGIARGTGRSSWAVLGAAGLLLAGGHFAQEWSHGTREAGLSGLTTLTTRGWVPPLVFAFVGFLLVALGRARRPDA